MDLAKTLADYLSAPGGITALVVAALSMIQVSPIKVNPWSFFAKRMGRAVNGELYKKVDDVAELLNSHIELDESRTADRKRSRILHFNGEVLRGIDHTEEEFVDVLKDIDDYNAYCDTHKNYRNSRAVHAIANIERVYDERLLKNDFL